MLKSKSKIIISNGHSLFHLRIAAAELANREMLALFLTAGYPTSRVKNILSLLGVFKTAWGKRLLGREEPIPNNLIKTCWTSELIQHLGGAVEKITSNPLWAGLIRDYGLRLYAYNASKQVPHVAADIYHYRAGYGHDSVQNAKQRGMITLCDHSIAHPAVLDYLVKHEGQLSTEPSPKKISKLWANILVDIDQADYILVNSDFVKKTFVHEGWDPSKVHVIYLGVDDSFLEGLNRVRYSKKKRKKSAIEITFAGAFERRKGAKELAAAVSKLGEQGVNFKLNIAGGVSSDSLDFFRILQRHQKVQCHGFLSREKLAELLYCTDVFVFPSLAEGSARVIFEALACGCYVVTTPNSGSIVEDGVHGKLVAPGNAESLTTALSRTVLLGQETINEIGKSNAQLVCSQYRQSQYGDKLVTLYKKLQANFKN